MEKSVEHRGHGLADSARAVQGRMAGRDASGVSRRGSGADVVALEDGDVRAGSPEVVGGSEADHPPADDDGAGGVRGHVAFGSSRTFTDPVFRRLAAVDSALRY